MRILSSLVLLSFLSLTACGQFKNQADGLQSSASNSTLAAPGGESQSPTAAPVVPASDASALSICSVLNFQNVVWPTRLEKPDQTAMALSMNITGSYEGQSGWNNITGNADGQGISLGLLQQNLGQGTLQVLLLQLRAQDPSLWASFFTVADLASIDAMLNAWQSATGTVVSSKRVVLKADALSAGELFPDTDELSPLDIEDTNLTRARVTIKTTTASANAASVNWAVANILQSTNVLIPRWKTELRTMANSAAYRSIQTDQSLALYTRASAYFDAFGFTQLRSIALMYDFVVQNGGFSASNKAAFLAYVAANPSASESDRALELLQIRLMSVRADYRADVSSRKTTIINGKGLVHGTNRNLPVQYCYTPTTLGI